MTDVKWPWRRDDHTGDVVRQVVDVTRDVNEGAARAKERARILERAADELIRNNTRQLARPDRRRALDPAYRGPERRRP